jgi:hypothetical protein
MSLKHGKVISTLKKLMKELGIKTIKELLGVRTIQIARKILIDTIPTGYTEKDWIDKTLHIDHREPKEYFLKLYGDNLKQALIEANQVSNLRLITQRENNRKSNSYALMPDNTELPYSEWIATKSLPNVEDNGIISKENGTNIEQFSTVSHILPHSPTF